MKKGRVLTSLMMLALLSSIELANASGFALIEQSVSMMGNAYAGAAATAEDATTIYFNPAGMTKLCHCNEAIFGVHFVIPSAKFHDEGSLYKPPGTPGITDNELTGGNGGDCGQLGVIGNVYYARNLGCGFWAGLGINSPFGLKTVYDSDWKGRYHAIKSELITININPSIAYQITDTLSIGAGFSAMYAKAKLSNKIDFGFILFAQSMGVIGVPQRQDGFVEVEGDSWGYGGNLGLLWDITSCTSLGISWRSEVEQHIKGHADFNDVPELLGLVVFDTSAEAKVRLPQSASVSLYHQFSPCFEAMADVTWTGWDSLKKLVVKFKEFKELPTPVFVDTVTTLHWGNSWRYSIGGNYRPSECWILRAGLAYDQTPIQKSEFRTPRIPDASRYWLALGAGYQWLDCLAFDVAYAYLFVQDPKVHETFDEPENFIRGALHGKWNANVNIVSAQVRYDF